MARPQFEYEGTAVNIGRSCEYILIRNRGQPTMGGTPALGLGEVLTTPHRENVCYYEIFTDKASEQD